MTYLLPDGLGSVRHAVDSAGALAGFYNYDPYGVPIPAPPLPASNPYGYTGEWWETQPGLLHLRARWYDPAKAIFLSKDPWMGDLLRSQSINGWSYVEGNPVNRIDPSGRCWGPASFMRGLPGYDVTCGNLDMAILVAGHPQASTYEKAQAVAYVEAVGISHLVLAEGMAMGGYGLAAPLLGGGSVGTTTCAGGNCINEVRTGTNTVYTYLQDGTIRYVGITNDFYRRAGEHFRGKGWQIEPIPGLENLSLFSTHVREIQYIVARDKNYPKYRVRENNGKREIKPDLHEMSQN